VGHWIFAAAVAGFLGIAAPVVWRGAPLADDFNNCVAPTELGLAGFLSTSWHQLGAIRPARFLEILVGALVCRHMPFGVAIAISAAMTVTVAWLTRQLLRDLDTPEPWCSVGAALWLLQPLGTEAGLWPAALHVPVGLTFALIALRAFVRGRVGWGLAATLVAVLSVEQVIALLPAAAWVLTPPSKKKSATFGSVSVVAASLAAFMLWPGTNPRLHVSLAERLRVLVWDPAFYVGYPAVGLGIHSIPLAAWWARPWSALALAGGVLTGAVLGPALTAHTLPINAHRRREELLVFAAMIVLANVLVVLAVPHQGSPRVFTPTWLVLSIAVARLGASINWRHRSLPGAILGGFAAGALLSLAFSVSVRAQSASFSQHAARLVAAEAPEEGRVAVCGVQRTVVSPAPRGAFAVHDFVYDWAAERAVTYYTGRHLKFSLAGELWNTPCPQPPDVDVVITFDQLTAAAQQ
jgi:hypothetical protein